jgi:hypothetical protein
LSSEWKVLSSPLRYHFVYFSVILSIFGALVVFGTMVELILSQRTKWYKLWYLKKTPELETGSNDSVILLTVCELLCNMFILLTVCELLCNMFILVTLCELWFIAPLIFSNVYESCPQNGKYYPRH